MTAAKTYSLRERIRRSIYEKMFDVALFMASRLSEKDKKLFAWLLKPISERYDGMIYGVGIKYKRGANESKDEQAP